MQGTEPEGIAGDCFYVLIMYGGGLTAPALHAAVTAENESCSWPVPSEGQVRRGLRGLAYRSPPLVRQEGQGRRSRWYVTDHGYKMLDVWVPDGDPEPVRRPCGLGWPGQNVA